MCLCHPGYVGNGIGTLVYEISREAHWRHGHKTYLGLTLKPILRDIRNTF